MDKVGHSHAMGGLITGALVGAGLAIGGALLVGLSLAAAPVIGGVLLAVAAGAAIGETLGSFSFIFSLGLFQRHHFIGDHKPGDLEDFFFAHPMK